MSHAGAYHLLAHLRVRLYEKLRTLAPACLVGRQKGDILNIAVSDIETIEFFFAHTIGPMFTVILLPCTTLVLALCYHPLYAAVLLPIYLLISVAFPLAAVKLGRRVGMRYRERLGQMKAFVLESIYGLKDIQIFGAGNRRMEQVTQRGQAINRAAHGLTLHQQAVSSVPTFFVYLARISIVAVASYLTPGGDGRSCGCHPTLLCGHGLFLLHPIPHHRGLQLTGDLRRSRASVSPGGHSPGSSGSRPPPYRGPHPRNRL